MKKILIALGTEGRHFTFHCFAVAIALLGAFILSSAADMGPFMPLLVSAGIYIVVFAIALELVYWLGIGVRKLALRWVK